MHSRSSYLAIASLAALAFSGCEWGGAHENTWNDGYSWANFTGTYRFVNAVVYLPNQTKTDEEETTETEVATTSTTEYDTVHKNLPNVDEMDSDKKADGMVEAGNAGIVPGSFMVTVHAKSGTTTVVDNGTDGHWSNSSVNGKVDYASGAWGIDSSAFNASKGDKISIEYKYRNKKASPAVIDPGNQTDPGTYPNYSVVKLSYLKVTQQGNKLTMAGDSGNVYTGRLTGASTSKDGYVAAQTVRLSFEVSSADGQTITGHFSGNWSGSSDKNYGTLSNRQIHGTHSRAGNFVGTAADTTITVPTVTVNEFPTTVATE